MVRKESYSVHEAYGEPQVEKDEARVLGVNSVAHVKRSSYFDKGC